MHFCWVKMLAQKIWSSKFFDKSQVWRVDDLWLHYVHFQMHLFDFVWGTLGLKDVVDDD